MTEVEIIKVPMNILEAVIHELLHLRYQNHGKMFKVLLNTYLSKA